MAISSGMRMMMVGRTKDRRPEDWPERQEDMRFRDRNGRKRYDDGRFAPDNRYAPEHWREPLRRSIPAGRYSEGYTEEEPRRIGFDGGEAAGVIAFTGEAGRGSHGLSKETAREWVESMENEDGTRGAHWSMEQTEKVRKQKSLNCDPVEFWVAMNATYSDLCRLAKKFNVNNMDFYVDYVKDFWLNDRDAVADKLAAYYEAVVEK